MERKSLSDLQTWQHKTNRKPLILNSARQVGKTWILQEFGRRSYKNVAYINFEANTRMEALFASSLDIQRLLAGLRIEAGCPDKLCEYLKYYYLIGGMPECVSHFALTKDLTITREIQNQLLKAYDQDFSKYAEPSAVPRIRAIWDSIPSQLAREQKKFTYGLVREGARTREYEIAIQWLCDAGLLHKVHRVSKPGIPLRAYQEGNAFKLFMVDTGLLAAHSHIPLNTLLEGSDLFEEAKGALSEQYVAQELRLRDDLDLCYWSSDTSRMEVDFIVQHADSVYPIEVKSSENLQSKSLKSYREKFSPRRSFRVSLSPYRKESWLTNLPLYGLFGLRIGQNGVSLPA